MEKGRVELQVPFPKGARLTLLSLNRLPTPLMTYYQHQIPASTSGIMLLTMRTGMTAEQGDIVLIPTPFTYLPPKSPLNLT